MRAEVYEDFAHRSQHASIGDGARITSRSRTGMVLFAAGTGVAGGLRATLLPPEILPMFRWAGTVRVKINTMTQAVNEVSRVQLATM